MDSMDAYLQHHQFQRDAKVVSTDSELVEKSTTIEEDGEAIVLNNDETTETVTREVEGKLAEDVRKRVKASTDALVLITEEQTGYWLSEVTAETDYRMTVNCNGVEKAFNRFSASHNFQALLNWLDEDPDAPIGGEVF